MKIFTRYFLVLTLIAVRFTGFAGVIQSKFVRHSPPPVQEVHATAATATPTLSLYPNPSKGIVTISLSQRLGQDYKLRLSNIIGREVRTVALRSDLNTPTLAINLSDLPAGMYFYSLMLNDKAVSTKRLVLQN